MEKTLIKKKISIVIAVYQNENSLPETYSELRRVFEEELKDYISEIIFVDDGSEDGSYDELLKIKSSSNKIKIIRFTRNFGQVAAIMAGFKEASGDAVINISADLQDPIELIPQMVHLWEGGVENVICYRVDREDGFIAKFLSKFAYKFIKYSLPQIPEGGFDFLLMDKNALKIFNSFDIRHRFFQGDVLWAGFRTAFIPYTRLKRSFGESQWSISKKIKYFFDAIIDVSYLPIRIISILGFFTFMLGLIYSLIILVLWLNKSTPFTGWAPIMISILIVGGLIMLMLGIIGEYLWRIHEEVKKRPNYVIRQALDD
jgi:dolichol-phosphate mannosyltransferase